jgi:hypothetical protein
MNKYIPTKEDKERDLEEIRRVAKLLNVKPLHQGSNQDVDKLNKDGIKNNSK